MRSGRPPCVSAGASLFQQSSRIRRPFANAALEVTGATVADNPRSASTCLERALAGGVNGRVVALSPHEHPAICLIRHISHHRS